MTGEPSGEFLDRFSFSFVETVPIFGQASSFVLSFGFDRNSLRTFGPMLRARRSKSPWKRGTCSCKPEKRRPEADQPLFPPVFGVFALCSIFVLAVKNIDPGC
jgi:hypothetical protein